MKINHKNAEQRQIYTNTIDTSFRFDCKKLLFFKSVKQWKKKLKNKVFRALQYISQAK